MTLAIGADHGGVRLKDAIKAYLDERGIAYHDFGTFTEESVDYPVIAAKVAHAVANGQYDRGLLFCTTGIGVSMAANKVRGIRCALCGDSYSAEMTRRHNNANVLAVGAGIIGPNLAKKITEVFLTTEFEGGRHERRVQEIADIEAGLL